MTGVPDNLRLTSGSEASGFRMRVRDALGVFDSDAVAGWEASGHIPRESVAELAHRGLFRERWERGAEGGLSCLIELSQEAFLHSSGLALAVMGHSEMFIGALQWLAESTPQLALLEDALDGKAVGCFAATEPHGGSSLAGIQTAAAAVGDGWRLQGCKRYVSNIGGSSHVLVLARPDSARQAGDLGLFVVPLDTPGVIVDGYFGVMGIRACDVGQVSFDAELPGDALLGKAGLGLLYASHLLHFERISICAQLLASAETALRLSTAYARQRTIGGSRLMDKQVIRHRLVSCRAELWNLESRLRELTTKAQDQVSIPGREIAALKLVVGESTGRIIDACMQVLGARGCSGNFPMERLWRDCRLARIGGGTDEVLADLVASWLDRRDPDFENLVDGYLAADLPGQDRSGSRMTAEAMAMARIHSITQ